MDTHRHTKNGRARVTWYGRVQSIGCISHSFTGKMPTRNRGKDRRPDRLERCQELELECGVNGFSSRPEEDSRIRRVYIKAVHTVIRGTRGVACSWIGRLSIVVSYIIESFFSYHLIYIYSIIIIIKIYYYSTNRLITLRKELKWVTSRAGLISQLPFLQI